MVLTPMDIQHKEFNTKMKGYDREEVNDFLDAVRKDYEQLVRDQRELQKQLAFTEEKVTHFQGMQDTLNKSIVVAQEAADRLQENARKEAEMILFEAEKSADRLLKEAANKANRINQETESIRKESRNFRQKLQLMVESQLNLVLNEEWDHLLNATPEKEVKTPTLDDILMNRYGKVEDTQEEPAVFKEKAEADEAEAIEISV